MRQTYQPVSLSLLREGHFEATDLLLDCHAQLNVPSGSNDDTPLTLACWKGHEGVVGLLLEKQSSINHQTKTGCTPLMEATRLVLSTRCLFVYYETVSVDLICYAYISLSHSNIEYFVFL